MQTYLNYFDEKCIRSRSLTDQAKKIIPGGVQHNLAFNYPFPIAIKKAEGAYLWDEDDNQYIDFLQAGGPTILGSNYLPVRDKVIEMLQTCGPVTGLFHEYELKLAELIHSFMPSIEMFRMLGHRHRICHGSHSSGSCLYEAQENHQSWRRLPWLERFHGLWFACSRNGTA